MNRNLKRTGIVPGLAMCHGGQMSATDGYLSSDHGIKQFDQGVVLPHDTLATATNPAGTAWRLGGGEDVSLAYLRAFEKTIVGMNSLPPTATGGSVNFQMYEDSVGVGFGWSRE